MAEACFCDDCFSLARDMFFSARRLCCCFRERLLCQMDKVRRHAVQRETQVLARHGQHVS